MIVPAMRVTETMGRVGPVVVFIAVLAVAAGFVVFGVVRSIKAFGFGNGRVFTRPAAPWTLIGTAVLLLDAAALVVWLVTLP